MNEWREVKLYDIIDIIGGGTPKTSVDEYWGGDIPWLSVVDFNNGRKYVFETEKKITALGLDNSSTKMLGKGDLIISARGTVGVVSMLGRDMAFNQSCYGIKAKEDISFNDYVYYLLIHSVTELNQISHGGVFDTITRNTFKDIDITLPPLPEQIAIASVLSSLDDKIDLLHRQNETLEQMAEAMFRQWFVEEAEEEWEEGRISDVVTHHKKSVRPQQNKDILYHHFSIPSFDNNKSPVKEMGSEIRSNKYEIPKRCVMFSKLNPHKDKRVWLIQDKIEANSVSSTEFQIALPKDEKYLYFIYGWLNENQNYREISAGIGGTSGSHQRISPSSIFDFPCPIIPSKIIDKYNIIAEPIFKKIELNHEQMRSLTNLRDTLLPKLMSGEVRVEM